MNDMTPVRGLPAIPGTASNALMGLSRKAKAAIVVRLLINEGADIPLEELPDEFQARLTTQMGSMRTVDRDTLAAVIDEFTDELERIGLSFPGGIAGALDALDGKISRHTAARLRKEAGVKSTGDPWTRLRGLSPEKLLPVLENESVEIGAVMLSKLDVSLAAELLSRLPGPKARQVTYAVSLTNAVTPDAVDRIGLSLATQLDSEPLRAFDTNPVERVGAILNSSNTLTRDDVLTGLDDTDQIFANAVRKAIFTFANIPQRIAPRDIPRILREVDPAQLLLAIAGAEAAGFATARDYILENMSGRMADQLREDVEEAGKVKPADVEEAMGAIIAAIRRMEQSGDLLLVIEEEEEETDE
ncbi:flagellar motor switch protein FliG [Sulfitobacter sp. SK012]|uniref:flagellar motor switch protein FliG n=1 Tax=Sulfitobacter sp. SK012 TaxID=1389005 RepID=UPI000E0B0D64|nr:FliG C-terminal domain-containing protein [Sulfitobacter sp. SK012]AXI47244.1 flagellar motor switch protein FliG [Sulfitobacter sp. SK012]